VCFDPVSEDSAHAQFDGGVEADAHEDRLTEGENEMRQRWAKTVGIIVAIVALLVPAGARTLVNQTTNPNGTYADLVDALTREGRFSILIRAINAAGLTQTLRGKGPITLFGPSDAAFNKLPKAELDSLFKNPAELKQLVLHFMVGQRVSFKGMKAGDPTSLTLRMLDGSQVGLLCNLGHTRHWFGADQAAEIVRTDIVAGNGLVQEIDAVVAPGKNTPFGTDSRANSRVVGSGEAAAAGGGGSGRDTGRAAAAGGGGTGRDAARAAAAGGGGSGRDAGKTGLNGTGGIAGDGGIAAAAGGVGSGREGGKGTSDQAGSLMDILNRTGGFRIFIGLLNKAGLTTLLQDPKRSFTLFAPDDKAFSTLDKQLLSVLMSDSRAAREWLLPYILSRRLTSQELASPQLLGKPLETLAGRPGRVRRQGEFIVYELDFDPPAPISPALAARPGTRPCCARIVSADHPASNGIFHTIAW